MSTRSIQTNVTKKLLRPTRVVRTSNQGHPEHIDCSRMQRLTKHVLNHTTWIEKLQEYIDTNPNPLRE